MHLSSSKEPGFLYAKLSWDEAHDLAQFLAEATTTYAVPAPSTVKYFSRALGTMQRMYDNHPEFRATPS